MPDASQERRKAPRVKMDPASHVALPLIVPVEILDVSENGVLVISSTRLVTGRRCRLRLRLGHASFVAEVSVTRCTPSPSGGDHGHRIAAVFTDMTEENRRVLHEFLERTYA